ncbi:NAD(P)/FAD-dependent oxidoreductase [Conexibacter sp. SYSU D00693]|uniref:NAD(P)/FAD-dependent oxidoreductase n=1 Tax=Conexibacter sp. SYSU D00693 TaxID=2812560 RepID=UPI00196B5120|nr:FAD-dependent oxidoreductase [Conexibacter sp. SYSU D00693]
MGSLRVVIVGGGLAGHRAASVLLRDGFAGEVVLVGDERHAPYDRPPLSKQVLAGTMEPEACVFPPLDGVRHQAGAPAVELDADAHEVLLADGTAVPYDRLLVATGRRPRTSSVAAEVGGVLTLRGLDDALALRHAVRRARRVLVVGAGFIGCEVAATLRGLGVEEVTVVELASQPMPVTGPEVGRRAAALHAAHGVDLRLSTSVDELEPAGSGQLAHLSDGATVASDVVLVALGSVPNTDWLAGSALELDDRGAVVCDATCLAVGVEDVAAAGDVAAWPQPLAGGAPVSIEHWAIARDMGPVAARNLLATAEERRSFAPVPTFWSDQYDVKLKSAGLLSAADRFVVTEEEPDRRALVVEALRGDELVGVVAWNRTKKVIEHQRALAARLVEQVAA